MLDAITTRVPAGFLDLLHQALYRGTAYACLLALTALLGSLLPPATSLATRPAPRPR